MDFKKFENFSIILLNNINIQNTNCNGNIAVGGKATLKNFSLGLEYSGKVKNSFIVGEEIIAKNSINYSGNTILQNSENLKNCEMGNINGNLLYQQNLDFGDIKKGFKVISSFIKSKKNTVTNINKNELVFVSLFRNEPQFFNLKINDEFYVDIDFLVDSKSPIFINVYGKNITIEKFVLKINGKKMSKKSYNRFFWNFIDAESIDIKETDFFGSIFAINATIKVEKAKIYGNIFAKNLYCNGDIYFCKMNKYLLNYLNNIYIYLIQDYNLKKEKVLDTNLHNNSNLVVVEGRGLNRCCEVLKSKKNEREQFNMDNIEKALVNILKSITYEKDGVENILLEELYRLQKVFGKNYDKEEKDSLCKSINLTLLSVCEIQRLLIYKLEVVEEIFCKTKRVLINERADYMSSDFEKTKDFEKEEIVTILEKEIFTDEEQGLYSNERKYKKDEKYKGKCQEEWVCIDLGEDNGCNSLNSSLKDVVNSIAHQENGLGNILYSESKKICKTIDIAQSVDDLLTINTSVQNTIKDINRIQIILLDKLEEVSKICDGCYDDCN